MCKQPPLLIPALSLSVSAALLSTCLFSSVRAQALGGDPCASNLKQLAFAVSAYTQDYDGALPPMDTASSADTALASYLPKPDAVRCPVTGVSYKPNAALSAKLLAKMPHLNMIVLFRDAVAHPDGRVTQLYADGHIAHLSKMPRAKG